MTLFFIAFLAGVLTVLAPCILPMLPVIVGGSLADGKVNYRKALTVVSSLGFSVIVFTFILKISTSFIGIPQSVWGYVSGGIILLFGIFTLFPDLYEKIPLVNALNRSSNKAMSAGYREKSFWGDVTIGASLGPVFTTCSPTYFLILATILPRSISAGFLDLLAYSVGLSLALFVVAVVGQKIVGALGVASDPKGIFKKILGIVFIIIGISIILGYDQKLEASLVSGGIFDVTKVEQALLQNASSPASDGLQSTTDAPYTATATSSEVTSGGTDTSQTPKPVYLTAAQKQSKYKLSPEITNPSGFVNTDNLPITISQYRGKKVVLVDFWTYSCINCQRTTPYLNTWYSKYEDKGLVIIGVHTPEFSFEKIQSNVAEATVREGIKYPVVLDNDYSTWNAFGNQYWPRKYLIDIDGYMVYDHIGEGSYDETEKAIQAALMERNDRLSAGESIPTSISNPQDVVTLDASQLGSPETYFGSNRNQYLGNGAQGVSGSQTLTVPMSIGTNVLYLGGMWNFTPEYAEIQSAGDIVYTYQAKNVYMVASSEAGAKIDIYQDGVLVKDAAAEDVDKSTGSAMIKDERLYHLIQNVDYGEHTLRIHIEKAGLKAFTFTFG